MSDFFERNPLFQALNGFFEGKNQLSPIPIHTKNTTNALFIEAELAGYEKEEIHLQFDGQQIHIIAKPNRNQNRQKKERYIHVPFPIKHDEIKANYKSGLLQIKIPKETKQIDID